jgi:hypothetical protein
MGIQYLEKGDLVLKSWIGRVRFCCAQREMIEQMATSQIHFGLRDDLGSFHGLSIPERRVVLAGVSISWWHFVLGIEPTIVIRIPCSSLVSAGFL